MGLTQHVVENCKLVVPQASYESSIRIFDSSLGSVCSEHGCRVLLFAMVGATPQSMQSGF